MDEDTARRAAAEFLGGQAVADTLTVVRLDPLGWSVLQTGTRSNRGLVVADSGRVASDSLSLLTPEEALTRISAPE